MVILNICHNIALERTARIESCTCTITIITITIRYSVDNDEFGCCIFIDFKKSL